MCGSVTKHLSSACFNSEPKLIPPPPFLHSPLPHEKTATFPCSKKLCMNQTRHTNTSAIQNEYTSLQQYRMSTLHFSDTLIFFPCWKHYRRFEAIYTRLSHDGDISSTRKIFTCRFPETDVTVLVRITLCKENWIWIFRERVTCSRGQTLRAQT